LPRHHGTRDFIRPLLLWTGEMDHVRIASACEFTHGHHLLEAHHHYLLEAHHKAVRWLLQSPALLSKFYTILSFTAHTLFYSTIFFNPI
jgi:hypothetical protein